MVEIIFPDGTYLSALATKVYADALTGTNLTSFIIDQDNADAGVSSSIRFNRGATDGDAAIWWDETNDRFQFESDVGVTIGNIVVANISAANLMVTGGINLDGATGTIKISENDATGDMVFQVASGDAIVFKAV